MNLKTTLMAAALAAGLALTAAPANAAVVDFEGYTDTLAQLPFSGANIGGLTFDTNFYQYISASPGDGQADNGTDYYINGYYGATITKTGGGSFKLNSFDLARSYYTDSNFAVTFTFNHFGGGSTSATFGASPPSFTTHTFNLPQLASIQIGSTNGYVALDNITYNAVPEPTTWAMMLLGFFGLGSALRARRRVAAVA